MTNLHLAIGFGIWGTGSLSLMGGWAWLSVKMQRKAGIR